MNANRIKNTEVEIKKKGIVFVADHWGEFTGGIDVINQKLCEAMGYVVEQSKVEVICLVIVKPDRTPIGSKIVNQSKAEKNVIVIPYNVTQGETEAEIYDRAWKMIKERAACKDWVWIGHDIITGFHACALAEMTNGKSAIIFHTNYYMVHQDYSRRAGVEDYQEKYNLQQTLFKRADVVFGVGHWINDRFRSDSKENHVIIPGLEEKRKCSLNNQCIMISGRFQKELFDSNSNDQKNMNGVLDALVETFRILKQKEMKIKNFPVYFVGFEPQLGGEQLDELEKKIKKYIADGSKTTPYIHCKRFYSNREEYLELLAQSSVLVMASEQESFGLVAWEAVALEVPVVMSEDSGVYEHLDKELGYLMKGLCASFEAGFSEMNEKIGKCIADMLINYNKMKKATSILRKEMSVHKWEAVAIDIAKKMDVTDVMDEKIFNNSNCYEFAFSKRSLMFEELKRRIVSKNIKNRILFFEGVSRDLISDRDFTLSILRLISDKKCENVHVYLCYGTEKAIDQRVQEMDNGDLNLLKEKAKCIESIKNELHQIYEEDGLSTKTGYNFEECAKRIHLIPLKKSPSVYINILDDDWYFTQKFENRTSENTTVKIANGKDGIQEKERMVNHMQFILKDTEENEESKNLSVELMKWLDKERGN